MILSSAIRGFDSVDLDDIDASNISHISPDTTVESETMTNQSHNSNCDTHEYQHLPEEFGFQKHKAHPLLTRHPSPHSGRDDDPEKLREIADDVLTKMSYHDLRPENHRHKILFGPDHKIGKKLFLLQKSNPKYQVFLPEFRMLHLRKHKITVLFSAYKEAGLVHLLRYMRDDQIEDWKKLITAANIDLATRAVRRLAVALRLAFLPVSSAPLVRRNSRNL
jgi:hypothetical protein